MQVVPDAVVMGGRSDRVLQRVPQEEAGDPEAEHDKRDQPPAVAFQRLDQQEADGNEGGQQHVGDQHIGIAGRITDTAGNVAAEAEPHERLDQLVHREQHRQRADDQLPARVHLPQRGDADHADGGSCDEIGLRRKTDQVPISALPVRA